MVLLSPQWIWGSNLTGGHDRLSCPRGGYSLETLPYLINGFALSSVVRACLVLAPAATPFMHAILCCSTRLP